MPGLLLKLAPHERILVNGLLFENGPKKTKMTLHSEGAHVLRLRDALHPEAVVGPVSRAYHVSQLAVAGESDTDTSVDALSPGLDELARVFANTPQETAIDEARAALTQRNFYKVMRALKDLLPLEVDMLRAKVA
jgi:flagellar protein FlbT